MSEPTEHRGSIDASPGVAPPEPTYGPAITVEVDGQVFQLRPDGRGGTSYDWMSGPNAGYGFGSSPTADYSLDDHCESIRGFLGMIDPTTGFIGD